MDTQPGTIWGREPAMVLALVQAVIALVVAFGLQLAPDQIGAILAVTAVVLGLITRSQVSPAPDPTPFSQAQLDAAEKLAAAAVKAAADRAAAAYGA